MAAHCVMPTATGSGALASPATTLGILAAIVTLAMGNTDASAQSRQPPLDVKTCLREAREAIDTLKPAAEKVSGKPLDIVPPTMVDIFSSARTHGQRQDNFVDYTARVDGNAVRVAADFCRASAEAKLAIIAHELGHIIDAASGTEPGQGHRGWSADPREISATRRGSEILRAAGVDDLGFVLALPAEHLVPAGILRPADVSTLAQKIVGTRKIHLFQFDGKPGDWLFWPGNRIEFRYAATDAVVDDFLLVYNIVRQSSKMRRWNDIAQAEAAARIYRSAGGDLAAVASALEAHAQPRGETSPPESTRHRNPLANADIAVAVRRVMTKAPASTGPSALH